MSTDIHSVLVQVQPVFSAREEWETLASEEGLFFEALELSMQPLLYEEGLLDSYLEWYGSCKRTTSVHGAFIDVNPASGDPAFMELSRKRCIESCERAGAIGAKNVVFHCSCFPVLRGGYLNVWAKWSAEFYRELVDTYDVKLFIENCFDVDTEPLCRLMEECDDDRIGVCLDIGHANYSRIPLKQWFTDLGDRIGYLHLSDNAGAFDDHLDLGEGTIDWAEADALWRGLDRDTVLTLEVGGLDGVKNAVSFLRKNSWFGF